MARTLLLVIGLWTAAAVPPHLLYITVDDLRPELPGAFGHDGVFAPTFASLAESGTTFQRAYCQQAVCSPSRMSFMTGRYPTRTRSWNFINHALEPVCEVRDQWNCPGNDLVSFAIDNVQGRESSCSQACTMYSSPEGVPCKAWVYNFDKNVCFLKSAASGCKQQADTMTGQRCRASRWTPLPLALKQQGWEVYGTSKLWHPDEGGVCPPGVEPGPHAPGTPKGSPFRFCAGLPPAADPRGWMNDTVQYPPGGYFHGTYQIPPMEPCPKPGGPAFPQGCALPNDAYFADANVSEFAIAKLRAYKARQAAAAARGDEAPGPLATFVGFRKPHLAFRFPEDMLRHYSLDDETLPQQRTLDPSISPWAFHDVRWPGATPTTALDSNRTRVLRLYYKAAISWVDSQLKRLLDAYQETGLSNNTIVVLHSDHGWSLGESGEWRKFTEWEQGTRVPLVIRDPRATASHGRQVWDPVELVDVYRTVVDLLGADLPSGDDYPVDGRSLRPALADTPGPAGNGVALSMFPRCPTNESEPWKDNWCEFVSRTRFPVMGFAARVANETAGHWRYVEWRRWNGTRQDGDWSPGGLVARGLYQHEPRSLSFDVERRSVAAENPDVVQRLAPLLASSFARIAARPVGPDASGA